jgi:hypothetical protein
MQLPPADAGMGIIDYQIQTEPPGLDRLSRVETEADLFERIRQENLARGERVNFPDEPVLSTDTYLGRNWPRTDMLLAPYYVCHGRLLFQQKNAERYGWDLGPFHPLLSGLVFFADMAALPYRVATNPCCCYDCSAGYCLPGDPVPFLLYPPKSSLTGLFAEGATIAALLAIFP